MIIPKFKKEDIVIIEVVPEFTKQYRFMGANEVSYRCRSMESLMGKPIKIKEIVLLADDYIGYRIYNCPSRELKADQWIYEEHWLQPYYAGLKCLVNCREADEDEI